jgi:hypothetical protein
MWTHHGLQITDQMFKSNLTFALFVFLLCKLTSGIGWFKMIVDKYGNYVQSRPRNFASRHSTDISCKTGFIYFNISNPTLEFLTWMSIWQSIFIVRDRISVTNILNVSHNDNKT